MSKEEKAQIIESLQGSFSKSTITILTGYRGLVTSEITDLRRKLQEADSEYRVVKNTLARFAAERAGKDDLLSSFDGPIAIAFGYGSITAPAKVLTSYIANSDGTMSIKGGFLDGKLLSVEQIQTLSTLPSREVLLSMVLGQIGSPIAALLGYLTTPIRNIAGVLQFRIKQLEGE